MAPVPPSPHHLQEAGLSLRAGAGQVMLSTNLPRTHLRHGPTAPEGAAGIPCCVPCPPSPRHPARCPLPFPARRSLLSPPPPLELLPPLRCRSWQRLRCREPGLLLASSQQLASWRRSSHAGIAAGRPPAPRGAGRCRLAQARAGARGPRASPGPEWLAAVPMSHLIRLGSSPGTEDVRRKQEAARGPEGVGASPGLTLRHRHRCPEPWRVRCPRELPLLMAASRHLSGGEGSAKLLKALFCSCWTRPVLLAPCPCGTVRLLPTRCSPLRCPLAGRAGAGAVDGQP